MTRTKAAAAAAAFVALGAMLAVVGTVSYVATRDGTDPPPTTTTTTTPPPSADEVAAAVAAALGDGLDLDLTTDEARCVADGLLAGLGLVRLEDVAGDTGRLTPTEHAALVRTVVLCVPSEKAAALLSPATTTTTVGALPDEGG